MVKKFNELNENNSNDVFNSKNYSDKYCYDISDQKERIMHALKQWGERQNYTPEENTINEILTSYYYAVSTSVDHGDIYEFFWNYIDAYGNNIDTSDMTIDEAIAFMIKEEEGEELYNMKKATKKFKI